MVQERGAALVGAGNAIPHSLGPSEEDGLLPQSNLPRSALGSDRRWEDGSHSGLSSVAGFTDESGGASPYNQPPRGLPERRSSSEPSEEEGGPRSHPHRRTSVNGGARAARSTRLLSLPNPSNQGHNQAARITLTPLPRASPSPERERALIRTGSPVLCPAILRRESLRGVPEASVLQPDSGESCTSMTHLERPSSTPVRRYNSRGSVSAVGAGGASPVLGHSESGNNPDFSGSGGGPVAHSSSLEELAVPSMRRSGSKLDQHKSQIARARWVHATWYALQEVQRNRAERKAQEAEHGIYGSAAMRSPSMRAGTFRRDSQLSAGSVRSGISSSPVGVSPINFFNQRGRSSKSKPFLAGAFGTSMGSLAGDPGSVMQRSESLRRPSSPLLPTSGMDRTRVMALHTDSPENSFRRNLSGQQVASIFHHPSRSTSPARSRLSYLVERFIGSRWGFGISAACSLWLLVVRDAYFAIAEGTAGDVVALWLSLICLVLLILEVAAWSMIYPRIYLLSVVSVLDTLAALSLLDDAVYATTGGGATIGLLEKFKITRATHAAASGTRLLKIFRAASLWQRLLLVVALPEKTRPDSAGTTASNEPHEMFKDDDVTMPPPLSPSNAHSASVRTLHPPPNPPTPTKSFSRRNLVVPGEGYEAVGESEVGLKLDAGIASSQVAVVLLMLLLTSLLEVWAGGDVVRGLQQAGRAEAASLARAFAHNSALGNETLTAIAQEAAQRGSPLLYAEVGGVGVFGGEDARRRYPLEVVEVQVEGGGGFVRYDARVPAVVGHWRAVILALGVITVLGGSAMVLSGMVHREVVAPMQRMVSLVTSFARDPLKPLTPADPHTVHSLRETLIVQNALVKFGSLLQLGFGEAGAEMLSRQMEDGVPMAHNLHALSGRLNSGKVVHAFFGFCDIRYFTDLTEVLQADVVRVVNTVARHVHTAASDNYGAPNKNMGDAFLVVWKSKGGIGVRAVADAALRSFIRTVLEVSADKELAKMSRRPEVQTRLPGFRVRMGFGLHYGWAIECAIGSNKKIDASYISPHVNLSSRLEAATKQYGVELLLSGQTHGLFSPNVQSLCRLVDRVTVKGTLTPMELFTYDVPSTKVNGVSVVDDEFVSSPSTSTMQFFAALQPATSERFRLTFRAAMDNYLGGADGSRADWKKAMTLLQHCLLAEPHDGPTQAVRAYIMKRQRIDGSCPSNWRGFRVLDSK